MSVVDEAVKAMREATQELTRLKARVEHLRAVTRQLFEACIASIGISVATLAILALFLT